MRKIIVNTLDKRSRINRNIYGNFSEHLEDIATAGGRVRFILPGCSVAEITVR